MTTPLQEAINDLQFMRDKATDAFSDIVWGMAITILRDVHIEKEKQFLDAAREDEAVGFTEWVCRSCTVHSQNGKSHRYVHGDGYETTTELYQLYLKHKNEKK